MTGEAGNDIYYVDHTSDLVIEAANGGIDTVRTTLAATMAAANVENLQYIGTGNFRGTGNALANEIRGGAGNDDLATTRSSAARAPMPSSSNPHSARPTSIPFATSMRPPTRSIWRTPFSPR